MCYFFFYFSVFSLIICVNLNYFKGLLFEIIDINY
nr:MAG TPA: hypothetical protein [Caudoviricetes sp.]